MRALLAILIMGAGFMALPAHACMGPMLENTLFFERMPEPKLEADVVAKVVLENVKDGTATARIEEIMEAPKESLHKGDKVELTYSFSSCGPNHKAGDAGMIIAKLAAADKGKAVLHAYARRNSDNQIEPPLK